MKNLLIYKSSIKFESIVYKWIKLFFLKLSVFNSIFLLKLLWNNIFNHNLKYNKKAKSIFCWIKKFIYHSVGIKY